MPATRPRKRRLRLELASARSPNELAKEVRKRLTIIARSRSFVDWQGMALVPSVLGRCDDSSGTVIGVFRAACGSMGEVALKASRIGYSKP